MSALSGKPSALEGGRGGVGESTALGSLVDAGRVRSFSTSPAFLLGSRIRQAPPTKQREMLLRAVKDTCDQDLRAYLAVHEHTKEGDTSTENIVACVRKLIACDVAEVSDGVFAALLNELRGFQQCIQREKGSTPESVELTQLLLSASRVTRLAEFTSFMIKVPQTASNASAASRGQVARSQISAPTGEPALIGHDDSFDSSSSQGYGVRDSASLLGTSVPSGSGFKYINGASGDGIELLSPRSSNGRAAHSRDISSSTVVMKPTAVLPESTKEYDDQEESLSSATITTAPVTAATTTTATTATTTKNLASGKKTEETERSSFENGVPSAEDKNKKKHDLSFMSYFISKVKCFISSTGTKGKNSGAKPQDSDEVSSTASSRQSSPVAMVQQESKGDKKIVQDKRQQSSTVQPSSNDDSCNRIAIPIETNEGTLGSSINISSSKLKRKAVLCRICEQLIPSDEMDKHAKMCAQRSAILSRINALKTELEQAAASLERRLNKSLKIMQSPQNQPLQQQQPQQQPQQSNASLQAASAAFLKSLLSAVPEYGVDPKGHDVRPFFLSLKSNLEPLTHISYFSQRAQDVLRCINELSALGKELQALGPDSSTSMTIIPTGARIQDFDFLRAISRGAFGSVYLARKKRTGDLYAIKRLNKRQAVMKNQLTHITAERNILASTNSPFLIRSYYSFQTKDNLYLVMEYAPGGDLYSLLRQLGSLEEDVARMYLAQIVLALEYLHGLGIVHRDLKPDNLLISADGHLKLTDFGLSRYGLIDAQQGQDTAIFNSVFMPQDVQEAFGVQPCHSPSCEREATLEHVKSSSPVLPLTGTIPVDSQLTTATTTTSTTTTSTTATKEEEPVPSHFSHRQRHSVVGTPDYLAPEVILGTGHDQGVDWWALGVICYEFITGVPPFNDNTPEKIFEHILNRAIVWPKIPEEMSEEAHDFIDKLLSIDRSQRLGAHGASEVKSHPFFRGIDWDRLLDPENAVFVPQLDSPEDLSYFDTERREASMSGVQRDLKAVKANNPSISKISAESLSSDSANNSTEKTGSIDSSLESGVPVLPTSRTPTSGSAACAAFSNDTGSSFSSEDHNTKCSTTPPNALFVARSPQSGQSVSPNTSQDEFFKNFSYQNLPNLSLLTMQKLQSAATPVSPSLAEDLFPPPP